MKNTLAVCAIAFLPAAAAAQWDSDRYTSPRNATVDAKGATLVEVTARAGTLDSIWFNISGTAPFTIALQSALPTINDPVMLDGFTQPGYTGTPLIELNGAAAGANATGLGIGAGPSTVRGLAINRFDGPGIGHRTCGFAPARDGAQPSGTGGRCSRHAGHGGDAACRASLAACRFHDPVGGCEGPDTRRNDRS